MIREFTYQAQPMRVVFGPGTTATLSDELEFLGLHRLLVICGPQQAEVGRQIVGALGERAVGLLAQARMHVPVELAASAREQASQLGADGCVAVGGGSAIGLGKAIALESAIPVVAVPTTYAGSEMTPVWGLTEAGVKRTGRDQRVLPRSVVYDPELTLSLPVPLSVTSALNAIAHSVEALYAPDLTPIIALMAEEGIRSMVSALPGIVADGRSLGARSEAQYAAWLCGACLAATTMGLHHKLCHALGGTLDLPHAQTHAVVLPHVLAFNASVTPSAVSALRRALGSGDPAGDPALELWRLSRSLGAPGSLKDLGMNHADISRVAEVVMAAPYPNPRPVSRADVVSLLSAAYEGTEPAAVSHID
jgi:maleylacetate reductase